jgi:hypothetical protein
LDSNVYISSGFASFRGKIIRTVPNIILFREARKNYGKIPLQNLSHKNFKT